MTGNDIQTDVFLAEHLEVVIAGDPQGPSSFCLIQDTKTRDLFVPTKYVRSIFRQQEIIESIKNRRVFPDDPNCTLLWPTSLKIPMLTKQKLHDKGFPKTRNNEELKCLHIGILYSALQTHKEYGLSRMVLSMYIQRTDATYMRREVEEKKKNVRTIQELQDQIAYLEALVNGMQEWMNLATLSLSELVSVVYGHQQSM